MNISTFAQRAYKWVYPSIQVRLTAPFLLAIIALAAIGSLIVTRLVAGSILERVDNQLIESAKAATNAISDIEGQQLGTLRLMVFTQGVDTALTTNDDEQLETLLRPLGGNAALDEFVVFNAAGRGLLRFERIQDIDGIRLSELPTDGVEEWTGVQRVISQQVDQFGDKHIDVVEVDDSTIFYFLAPVYTEDGEFVGGVGVGIDASRFAARVSEQALSPIAFYSPEGNLLGNSFLNVAQINLQLSTTEAEDIFTSLDKDRSARQISIGETSYQGYYAPLVIRDQQIGFMLVGLPSDFVTDRIGTSRNSFIALFGISFVTIVVLGVVISRSITGPVKHLVDITRAIREGDLTRRVDLHTPDELGELGASFDHMTSELIARNQEVESLYRLQVEETAQREAVLASINDAVFVVHPREGIVMENDAGRILLEELNEFPDDQAFFHELHESPESLRHGAEIAILNRYYTVVATPIQSYTSNVANYVIALHDVTGFKEADLLKEKIIRQLSHELRTPLTSAIGYLELVKSVTKDNLTEQQQTFVVKSLDHLRTLEYVTNQVLKVSVLIAGSMELNHKHFNFMDLIRMQIAQHRSIIQDRGIKFAAYALKDEIVVYGDEARLIEVIQQLLRNAYSYTPDGGEIKVIVREEDTQLVFMVQDNGIGIDEEELPHVYDVLYRGQGSEAGPTDTRGMGIGLFVVKQVVEAHQGTVEIDSKLGKGTLVTIRIPLHGGFDTWLEV
ncbi:MAG: ATP-binding protein [Chloroflexi bacterium]|nr:ATP-binding protein [Chloroflexota bacterium]